MNDWLIYSVYVCFIIALTWWFWTNMNRLRKDVKHWARIAAEAEVRATHWNKQFNEVIEGKDGAWARRMISENEGLSKGLDEAIDDHMQEQAGWDEARTQYKATIAGLIDEAHEWNTRYCQVRDELEDVKQTALEMQIELTAPEAKTPEQIYRETNEALGKHDRISPDAEITLADDAALKDPSGAVIGTVDGVHNTPEGIVVDMTFNDNVPWAGKSATGVVPHDD